MIDWPLKVRTSTPWSKFGVSWKINWTDLSYIQREDFGLSCRRHEITLVLKFSGNRPYIYMMQKKVNMFRSVSCSNNSGHHCKPRGDCFYFAVNKTVLARLAYSQRSLHYTTTSYILHWNAMNMCTTFSEHFFILFKYWCFSYTNASLYWFPLTSPPPPQSCLQNLNPHSLPL